MTEQPQAPYGQMTAGQAAAVAASQLADQAAASAAASTDAGPSVEQMQADQRQVLLPMEQRINEMMAAFQTSQDQQAKQIAELQAALAAARQAAGPPAVEQYANGVAALIKAHANANPDLPGEHFSDALGAAEQLKAEATAAVASRDTTQVESLARLIETWARKFRAKHLDMSALLADLELLGEASARLKS